MLLFEFAILPQGAIQRKPALFARLPSLLPQLRLKGFEPQKHSNSALFAAWMRLRALSRTRLAPPTPPEALFAVEHPPLLYFLPRPPCSGVYPVGTVKSGTKYIISPYPLCRTLSPSYRIVTLLRGHVSNGVSTWTRNSNENTFQSYRKSIPIVSCLKLVAEGRQETKLQSAHP